MYSVHRHNNSRWVSRACVLKAQAPDGALGINTPLPSICCPDLLSNLMFSSFFQIFCFVVQISVAHFLMVCRGVMLGKVIS